MTANQFYNSFWDHSSIVLDPRWKSNRIKALDDLSGTLCALLSQRVCYQMIVMTSAAIYNLVCSLFCNKWIYLKSRNVLMVIRTHRNPLEAVWAEVE